jgi:HrpA-like RNA helicase
MMYVSANEKAVSLIVHRYVAETSITIDGIRFVCDSGRHKEMLHSATSGGRGCM